MKVPSPAPLVQVPTSQISLYSNRKKARQMASLGALFLVWCGTTVGFGTMSRPILCAHCKGSCPCTQTSPWDPADWPWWLWAQAQAPGWELSGNQAEGLKSVAKIDRICKFELTFWFHVWDQFELASFLRLIPSQTSSAGRGGSLQVWTMFTTGASMGECELMTHPTEQEKKFKERASGEGGQGELQRKRGQEHCWCFWWMLSQYDLVIFIKSKIGCTLAVITLLEPAVQSRSVEKIQYHTFVDISVYDQTRTTMQVQLKGMTAQATDLQWYFVLCCKNSESWQNVSFTSDPICIKQKPHKAIWKLPYLWFWKWSLKAVWDQTDSEQCDLEFVVLIHSGAGFTHVQEVQCRRLTSSLDFTKCNPGTPSESWFRRQLM